MDSAEQAHREALNEQAQLARMDRLAPIRNLGAAYPGLLMHAALLHDFQHEEVLTLGAHMLHVRARPGQAVIQEGELGHWMLLVLEGTLDVTKRSPRNGEPSRLAVVQRGASIGEMSMFDGEPRYATCTAIETVHAGVLTRRAVATLIQEHPAVGAKLLVKLTQLLAQRLRNTSNQLVKALGSQGAASGA